MQLLQLPMLPIPIGNWNGHWQHFHIGNIKQRPFHHRRPEGNLLDWRVAQGLGPPHLRRGEDGRGDHPWASRINPQGDVGTAGIRQRQEGGMRKGRESFTQVAEITGVHEMIEQILSKSNKHSLKLFSKEGIEWLEKRSFQRQVFRP